MTERIVEEIKKGNKRAVIVYDEFAEDPRTWFEPLGTMVCGHKRYRLGDEQINVSDYESWDEIEEYLVKERNAEIILPLYLYDHSGITMNTTGFSCGWDSGKVGYIYISKEKCIEEFGENYDKKKITKYLIDEVDEYDSYLTGEVYGFKMFETKHRVNRCPHCDGIYDEEDIEEEMDACWGFYGDIKYVREEVHALLGD